nr:hypothetical protein GCM10020063_003560 [Dactylosporangium thailandense]
MAVTASNAADPAPAPGSATNTSTPRSTDHTRFASFTPNLRRAAANFAQLGIARNRDAWPPSPTWATNPRLPVRRPKGVKLTERIAAAAHHLITRPTMRRAHSGVSEGIPAAAADLAAGRRHELDRRRTVLAGVSMARSERLVPIGGRTMHLVVCNLPDDAGIDWLPDAEVRATVEDGGYHTGRGLAGSWPARA